MGRVSDRLNALVVRAASPDGNIAGVYSVSDGLSLRFRPGAYQGYKEQQLSQQLSRLCLRLWASYQRGHEESLATATGRQAGQATRNPETWDANRRRYRADQAETESEGMSPSGAIYLKTVGMVRWDVVIRDGSLSRMEEGQFVQDAIGAFQTMLLNYRANMAQLRAKHYDTDSPTRKEETK